mgnify:CR=1
MIGELEEIHRFGGTRSRELNAWLDELPPDMQERLATRGLVDESESITVGRWSERYQAEKRGTWSDGTAKKVGASLRSFVGHVGPDLRVAELTPEACSAWAMVERGRVSESTAGQRIGDVKTWFNAAIKRGLMESNPIRHEKSGTLPRERMHYVDDDEAYRLIEACPSLEWKVVVALARYAGLRVPDEPPRLVWSDDDAEGRRLRVPKGKTRRKRGKGWTVVPVPPILADLLEQLRPRGARPSDRIITIPYTSCSGVLTRAMQRAGLSWPARWQMLRASYATWVRQFVKW